MNFQLKKPSAVLKHLGSIDDNREPEGNIISEPEESSLQKDERNHGYK